MIRTTLACLLSAGACAASASAGLGISHEWVLVDNTVGNPGGDPGANGAAWNSTDWVTYDLYLTVTGRLVNGINLGSAPGEEHLGINFDVPVFNTTGPVASNFESSFQTFPGFATSLYDTYVTLGDNNPGGAAPNELLGVALNGLVPQDGVLRGAWAHNPVEGGTPQDASEGMRILRITFDRDALVNPGGSLVGSGTIQIGLSNGAAIEYSLVPPAPGAAALIGIGGVFAARRRR